MNAFSGRAGRHAAVVLAGALLLGASPLLADDVPPKAGPDFPVNTHTFGSQDSPDVVRYPGGRFVAVWNDWGAFPVTVKARFYDGSGAPTSGEIGLATTTLSFSPPRVAAMPDGGFGLVWRDVEKVFLRRFDREAQPLSNAVDVDQSPEANLSPDVAADVAGNIAVVWLKDGIFEDLVLLRRFDAATNPLGDAVQVNQKPGRVRRSPRVAMNGKGSVLVSWDDDSRSNVTERRFDGPSGSWSDEVRLAAPFGGHSSSSTPVLYAEGDGAVVFSDLRATDVGIFAQRLDAAGKPLGEVVEIGGGLIEGQIPDVAVDGAGNAFVVWTRPEPSFSSRIFGRLFDRSWQPLGGDFAVSADPLNLGTDDLEPAVAGDPSRGFVTVWANGRNPDFLFPIPLPPQILNGRDGSMFGVFGQVFGSPKCLAGSAVLCLGPDGRFEARASWKIPSSGETGVGRSLPLTPDTGALWFFGANNLEAMIKVLDGRAVNGYFWVYLGSLSNVEYTITVTDTVTGSQKSYHNPPGQFASQADTKAFVDSEPVFCGAAATVAPALLQRPQTLPESAGCAASQESLCLAGGRFQVQVDFVDPRDGAAGRGKAIPLTGDTGVFWFFDPKNLEAMIKILDGRGANGHFWIIFGALSDVEYTITVTDTETGERRTYANRRGQLASRADLDAFPGGN